jgi:RimJ/RimL family protein N-acetyltransferase
MSQMPVLRLAGPEDEQRLLDWRNERGVREASFSSDEISPEEHHRWFADNLLDPGCALLIVEDDGRPVGQVRLERVGTDLAEISVALASDVRGRGVGREALRLAASMAPQLLGVTTLKALVKEENEASLRAFRAAGFRDIATDHGVVELRVSGG